MRMHNKMFGISMILHVILLIVFYFLKDKLDVFMLISFMLLPIIFNFILSAIGSKTEKIKSNVIITAGFYVCINIVYWIFVNILLNLGNTLEKIYERSRQYNSDMIEVSNNNSPIGAIVLLALFAYVIYYFIIKKLAKKENV